jgi:hypothetical protein
MQKSDRALLRRFRRRLNFAVRYFEAKKRSKLIAKLLPILERSFDHPWVAGVELKIRFWPGNETKLGELPRVYKSLPAQSMHWDMRQLQFRYLENEKEGKGRKRKEKEGKGRKRKEKEGKGRKRQALCMSIYLVKDVLYIRQIQGIAGTAPQRSFAIGQRFS